jgi:hypothetical protein
VRPITIMLVAAPASPAPQQAGREPWLFVAGAFSTDFRAHATAGMMQLSMGGSFFLPGSGGFGSSQKGALRSCPWADNRTVQGRRPPHEATFPLSSSVSRSAVSVDVIEHRQQLGTPVMRRAGASGKRRPRTHAPSQKNVCTSLPREPDGSVDRSHPPYCL